MEITPKDIKKLVEKTMNIKDLKAKKRDDHYSDARTIYSRLCFDFLLFRCSQERIAKEINRNRTTVLHLATKAFPKRSQRLKFKEVYSELYNILKSIRAEYEEIEEIEEIAEPDNIVESVAYEKLLKKKEKELIELKAKYLNLKKRLKDPLLVDIVELDERQSKMFRERAELALKFIKNYKFN